MSLCFKLGSCTGSDLWHFQTYNAGGLALGMAMLVCLSVNWSNTLVQTEISQQLSDGLPWDTHVSHTMYPNDSGEPWLFPCSTMGLTFVVFSKMSQQVFVKLVNSLNLIHTFMSPLVCIVSQVIPWLFMHTLVSGEIPAKLMTSPSA